MLTVQQYAKGENIPQQYLNNANLTVRIVNDIFNQFPNQFSFNSGYRTPAHNAAVGGVANSYHVQALAADVAPLNGNYNQYKSALQTIVARYGWELIDERNKNHFHIEPSGNSSMIGNSQKLDVGVVGIVNVPIPKGDNDFFDSVGQTFEVSRETAIAGSVILGLVILTRL